MARTLKFEYFCPLRLFCVAKTAYLFYAMFFDKQSIMSAVI